MVLICLDSVINKQRPFGAPNSQMSGWESVVLGDQSLYEYQSSRRSHSGGETVEGHHLRPWEWWCHGHHVKQCSRSQGRCGLCTPLHPVCGLRSLVSKPMKSLLDGAPLLNLLTFMSAFESSPVHCLTFWPSWKCLTPKKGGAGAMLESDSVIIIWNLWEKTYHRSMSLSIRLAWTAGFDIACHPSDQVILEGPLN